jgi:hypothetical protein
MGDISVSYQLVQIEWLLLRRFREQAKWIRPNEPQLISNWFCVCVCVCASVEGWEVEGMLAWVYNCVCVRVMLVSSAYNYRLT